MYIDAHCHLDLPAFGADRAAVLARARAAGITRAIVAGVDPAGWRRQRALCAEEPGLFWTAGLHPWAVAQGADGAAALAALPACFEGEHAAIGVGELGLDGRKIYRERWTAQLESFRAQLAFARERDLPIVVHAVAAAGALLEVLRADGAPKAGGMVHSWSMSAELVPIYVRMGLAISLAGPVCAPRARRLHEVARKTPADWLLIETDSPDQPPEGWAQGGARNEPVALWTIARSVAQLREETAEALLSRSAKNVERIFPGIEGLPSTAEPAIVL